MSTPFCLDQKSGVIVFFKKHHIALYLKSESVSLSVVSDSF